MAVEGTLDLFKLPEILQLISQQKKTGILTVQGQQDIVAISFLNGRIVAADALSQTLEEGLAQVLVREGMITPSDLHRAAAEHQAAGGRLIDVLVERRYLERAQLLQALRLQTWRLLEQLLRWNEGDFKFYSGDEVSFEEGFDPISVEELLIHAAPAPASRPIAAPPPAAVRTAPPVAPAAARPAPAVPPPSAVLPPILPVSPLSPLLLALLVVGSLWRAPDSVMIPFFWQQRERAALARDQRAALYLKIDRAAKTWFLLKGSFPDRPGELVQASLLSSADLQDPKGYPLRYAASEESYTLQPMDGGKPVAGTEATEAITGNFLLDPEVLNVAPESQVAPLVLLD